MQPFSLSKAFTLIEPGPVVLVSTHDAGKDNVMTISWTMVMDFSPVFAITTGAWNYSYHALRHNRECVLAIPTVDMLDEVVGIGTDKFSRFALTRAPARYVAAPRLFIPAKPTRARCGSWGLTGSLVAYRCARNSSSGTPMSLAICRNKIGEMSRPG